jgi:hypothetical protein
VPAFRSLSSSSATARVVEGDAGDGPGDGAAVTVKAGRRIDEAVSGAGFARCGGVLVKLGGGAVQAAGECGMPERCVVGGQGIVGCRRPERGRGDLVLVVRAAVLI